MRLFFRLMGPMMVVVYLIFGMPACKHHPLVPEQPNDTIPTTPIDTLPLPGEPCDTNIVYFENDVLPILVSNCAISGCHDATTQQEGYVFSSYGGFINTDAVEPGDLNGSDMYEVITETDPDKIMPPPPNSLLSSSQIATIAQWISQGAQNNSCTSGGCDTTNVTFNATVKPILQNYCWGCHSGASPSGGINLTTYSGVSTVAANGRLYGAISHSSAYVAMPQGGNKLPDCYIQQIKLWIDDGAPNN